MGFGKKVEILLVFVTLCYIKNWYSIDFLVGLSSSWFRNASQNIHR